MELKRFVRTKGGKIIDTCDIDYKLNAFSNNLEDIIGEEIINTSLIISHLIELGDLIKIKVDDENVVYEVDNFIYETLDEIKPNVIELYTKQGRNYVLVAEKTDKGWEVL